MWLSYLYVAIKPKIMKKISIILFVVLISTQSFAQKKITVEDFTSNNIFSAKSVRGIRWMNDGQFYSALKDNAVVKYDVTTGNKVATILDGNSTQPSIVISDYTFSDDEQQVLLLTDRQSIYRRSYTAVYYIYNFSDGTMSKLASGRQAYGTFSPDGTKVAYTRENNLYYVSLNDMKEVLVTKDGESNHVINGSADWVYEEELSLTKAFYWSPDNKKIAYYRFDESKVPEYNLQLWHQGQLYPEDYRYKYPKAGETNSTVTINIFNLENKSTSLVDIGNDTDIYIARIDWTQNPDMLSVRRLNRLQNKMDILHANASSGKTSLILTDKSDTYVDVETLIYLNDGKHIITTSEQSGYKHIYFYTIEGKLVRQITSGDWEVASFAGVDQSGKRQKLYFTSFEESPLEQYFYSIDIAGKTKQKLSTKNGVSRVNMSNDFKYYLNYQSSATSVNKVELFQTKGNKRIKVLEDNVQLAARIKDYNLVNKEFFTFKTEQGTELNGYMLKPVNFNENNKYPVLMYQYSGPGSQNVSNSFAGGHYYWHQLLVQKGYMVVVIDGRGTGGRGADFKKQTYKQLGKLEVEDQIAGARYLAKLPYVDAARIGIWGWSFGGYTSSLAILRGNEVFSTAISVSPVTSWRYYDTIYTERFLRTPQENPSGYDSNSPATYAANLEGKFLLIHGTGDDNVHFENSVALADALIAEGKQFSSFYYPDRTHGIYSRNARVHLYTMMTNFILENL
jgi:dipeptidyl-peptidase 4